MKRSNIKLYNIIFPIWLLWIIPITWIVVLPANFLIDLLVITLTMKKLNLTDIKQKAKSVIVKTWLFGFISDFIGTFCMFSANLIEFDYNTELGQWWNINVANAVSYNPFVSVVSILWVTICVIITGVFIYLFNYKFAFKKLDVDETNKKKLALSLAIFTAPYLFYLPTALFY